jgi:RNA polymerase sigma-70 factor (ECF subfamily)
MPEQMDDIAVIQLVLQGQQSAYAILVDRYRQYVFTIALRFVNNRETAEELAQDVFVKAFRYLADFKGNSKFSTWLYTIVNTTCLSHIRKKKEETILLDNEKMVALTDHLGAGENPVSRMEQKSQQVMIENALKQLPETDGQLLSLFYQGEQSVEEIGVILGLSTSNVKVRLFRARQKMKEILSVSMV